MSYFKSLETELLETIKKAGYDLESFTLLKSNRPDLGDFQINDAMSLAKKYQKNPRDIAADIVSELEKNSKLVNINIAGPGFINFRLSDEYLIDYANSLIEDIKTNVDKADKKLKFVVDYGGANVAKTLHVGHLRPANIGEAIKRLLELLGHDVIGDVHFGDSGLQAGQVIMEIRERFPDLPCFKDDYNGEDFNLPIDSKDLEEIYPVASGKSKADENFKKEAEAITLEIQKREGAYYDLWKKIRKISIDDIKKVYEQLNCTFDLFEGELDSFDYFDEMDADLKKKNLTEISDGATIIDVSDPSDKKEIPPFMLYKSNGAALYGTTDLATIYGRVKRFNPDAIWYVVDKRQSMHFTQVFRAAKRANLKENLNLELQGFGTMNGNDGKPFKTRDGGVISLKALIKMVKDIAYEKLGANVEKEEKDQIAETIAIAAIKYADLLPFRETDYIFNPEKFADIEGKTGPYILYALIRMKSILSKVDNFDKKIHKITGDTERAIYLKLFEMTSIVQKSYNVRSLNELADYTHEVSSLFNSLYGEKPILGETYKEIRDTLITTVLVLKNTVELLLDVLAIKVPEKM